jgi:hypothetical protein
MKLSGSLLSGVGIGTIAGLLMVMWKREAKALIVNARSYNNQANESLEEPRDQAGNRFAGAMVDFSKRLSSIEEKHERCAASLDEGQRLIVAELRRLRILITVTLISSCFGVVAFTIVLLLAYVKY